MNISELNRGSEAFSHKLASSLCFIINSVKKRVG